jgi:hypothetical protein
MLKISAQSEQLLAFVVKGLSKKMVLVNFGKLPTKTTAKVPKRIP